MRIKQTPPSDLRSASQWARYTLGLWEDNENQKRRADAKVVADYYNNRQLPYLEDELKKMYTDRHSWDDKRKWAQNITQQITDARSQVYSFKVNRNVPGSKSSRNTIQERVTKEFSQKMRSLEPIVMLERTALVMSRWSDKKQRITCHTYHQYEFDLVFNPNNNDHELWAVILSDYCSSYEKSNIVIYTALDTFEFVGNKLLNEINHNLGVLPAVVVYDGDPGFEDYLEPDKNIINSNLEINVQYSHLLQNAQKQTFAVGVLTTLPEAGIPMTDDTDPDTGMPRKSEGDRRLDVSAEKWLVMSQTIDGAKGDFKFVQPNADFTGLIDTIRFVVSSLASSYGVTGAVEGIEPGNMPATKFLVNERARKALLGKYKAVFSDAEIELFEKSYLLAQKATPMPVVDLNKYSIDFIDTSNVLENVSAQDIIKLRELGIYDDIEIIRSYRPDLTREEANELIKLMIKAQKAINEQKEDEPQEVAPNPKQDEPEK